MNNELMIAYSEVDTIINLMNEKYISKIPIKLRELISKEKMVDYEVKVDLSKPLESQNISKKALAILAVLNYNYWCIDNEKKNELIKLYSENDNKYQEELRQKYNPDDIFKKQTEIETKTVIQNESEIQNNQMIEYKEKNNLFIKIINKIKELFRLT